MPRPPKPSLASIVAEAAPQDGRAVAAFARPAGGATLKERAKQLSVYLEPPVHDQLRDLAHVERTKIHTLMLEALDLLFEKRGARSIEQLMSPRS